MQPTIKTEWDLAHFYYTGITDPKLQTDIVSILPEVEAFAKKYESSLGSFTKPEELAAFFDDDEALGKKLAKPSYYLHYLESLDTQDAAVMKQQGELQSIFIEVGNHLLFISQAWKSLGYDTLIAWSREPVLVAHSNALVGTAESIKRILTEREEYVLNIKSRPLSIANALHDELVGSLEFEFEKDGKIELLTDSEIRMLRESPDRATRKKAFESIHKVYLSKTIQIALGNCYTGIVKNWSTKVTLRSYETVMEPRNISEELDNEVVDLLLQEVENAYPLYARYIRAKQKILGLDTMMNYDVFAPISTKETPMPLEEGLALHLDTMQDFDEEFYTYSLEMFATGRVDAFPKKGKRGGAFANYGKDEPSFVLLNYTGKLSDVPTLSHELGHAIHGHLSQVQRESVYGSGLCLAETASIFSEMLLSEKIQSRLSPEEYTNFLSGELFDAFSSIFRQIQYVLFERKVHETIHAGKELTYHDLNVLWRAEQIRMSGDSVTFDASAEEEIGWSTIPHIFNSPFYCYAYSFGHLLVFALYDRYRRDGKAFVNDYKDILRAGGSVRPKELLGRYGFDITKPEFYRLGLGEIERKLIKFEELANQVG